MSVSVDIDTPRTTPERTETRKHPEPQPIPWKSRQSWYLRLRRTGEFLVALLLLILTAPLLLLAAVLIKLTSRGPIIYSQTRVGRWGRPFTILKLRTMAHNCEHQSGPQWATAKDPRITWLGRLLRRTHLDELPQLWNVLRGDMSLIGPRPERPEFVVNLEKVIPHYRDRLQVRPGVTGLAQVQLPPDTDLSSVRRKLAYDLYYVRHFNMWLDLRILFCTGFKVLGVSFQLLRLLFRMPCRNTVEDNYKSLSKEARQAIAQMQPA
jgi:lipopolysaccharide/colanic/teichoic acid biosynthesis glycosyltransferase